MKILLIPFYELIPVGQTGTLSMVTGYTTTSTTYGPPTKDNKVKCGVIRQRFKKTMKLIFRVFPISWTAAARQVHLSEKKLISRRTTYISVHMIPDSKDYKGRYSLELKQL